MAAITLGTIAPKSNPACKFLILSISNLMKRGIVYDAKTIHPVVTFVPLTVPGTGKLTEAQGTKVAKCETRTIVKSYDEMWFDGSCFHHLSDERLIFRIVMKRY